MNRTQESMIGNSVALAQALDHVSHLAPINRPVLILGERGTGKELAADRLHFLSGRWDAPLLKVNCAAIAESLLESELFGHEPGAFTGASKTHRGRFERADGGTLFLDELGNMSLRLQEKLLRLVEYGEFERLGGQKTLQVDVRVVAATNADVPALAEKGEFRADLLDRLSFDVVHLPALRQRCEDIPELATHFALQMCAELGWELFPGFTDKAMTSLLQHSWPGNVRELKNTVERSLYRWATSETAVDTIVIDPFISPYGEIALEAPVADEGKEKEADVTRAPTDVVGDFSSQMEAIEKRLLEDALVENQQNQRLTAKALGLSYDQLRGMVRKYGLGKRKQRKKNA